jgi:thiopurine S-methyltransferase
MTPDFWQRRWQKNEIGFHETEGSQLLKTYFDAWKLASGSAVFVPLCGKTRDIAWLLDRGFSVVAIELSEAAVKALFEALGVEPKKQCENVFTKYSAPNLCVFVGDFFALTASDLGPVAGTYDRAALVALPTELRDRYTQHLLKVTGSSRQFLVTCDYDQALFAGPPFSVTQTEVERQYGSYYNIIQLYRHKMEGGFRGQGEVYEAVYLLESEPDRN